MAIAAALGEEELLSLRGVSSWRNRRPKRPMPKARQQPKRQCEADISSSASESLRDDVEKHRLANLHDGDSALQRMGPGPWGL